MRFTPHTILPLACLSLVLAAPTNTSSPTPASDAVPFVPANRVTTFPVCGILGFTSEPGDNDLGIFPPPPISLRGCIEACRRNATCNAVSYAEEFMLCSFYGRFMKFDHLDQDDTSNFAHYDEVCPCEGNIERP